LRVTEYLGWAATAVFVGSYLCHRSDALKRVQMIGALLWVVYGLLIQATPVVAANLLVFSAAGWALFSQAHSAAGEHDGARLPPSGQDGPTSLA
jgi:hypothetical protein